MEHSLSHTLQHYCTVFDANAFRVEVGAFIDEPLGQCKDCNIGDIFVLRRSASSAELILTAATPKRVAATSSFGETAAPVSVIARHKVMSERGLMLEILLLQVGSTRAILPLGPLVPGDEYTLMECVTVQEAQVFDHSASVSFIRGTHMTMATGEQVRVEDLRVGDLLLTRDHGPQPIRWIGHKTIRAEGHRAPVVIQKDAMNNINDLVLCPDHRLFVYQRTDTIGAGRAEVLVRARHLVNNDTIFVREGGFIDQFHLLFDNHEIVFVEGIQAESLFVSPHVIAGFDEDMAIGFSAAARHLRHVPTAGIEPSARDLAGIDVARALRRASHG